MFVNRRPLDGMVCGLRLATGHGASVVHHDTFQHNVPMHLEREGMLVPLFKRELLQLLL